MSSHTKVGFDLPESGHTRLGLNYSGRFILRIITLYRLSFSIERKSARVGSSARPGVSGVAPEMPVCDQAQDFVHHRRTNEGSVSGLIVRRRYLDDVTPNQVKAPKPTQQTLRLERGDTSDLGGPGARRVHRKIGRASCRERV